MSGCEVIAPTPRWGVTLPLPRLAGDGMSSSGKSVSAVSLCWDLGLGRGSCSPALSGQAPGGKGQDQPPSEAQDCLQRYPYQSQLSLRKGGARLGLMRDFPAV